MNRIVFYSWQSDLPNRTNRGFIQAALEKAAKAIANDSSNDDVPIIDRDTKDVPGAPHIAKAILAKVAAADVSIVQGRGEDRPTPNPNVLIEIGYALCSLGDARIVLLMNDAYGAPEDLPFDLKMHRVMTYNMPEDTADRSIERLSLQKKLEGAIRAALDSFNPKLPPIPSKANSFLAALYDNWSDLYVIDPTTSARSAHYYLFACGPHDDSLSRLLSGAVEAQFRDSIIQAFGSPEPDRQPIRKPRTTTFERRGDDYTSGRQRFSLTGNGALGFVSLACAHTSDGLLVFFPTEFLYHLASFLACAWTFNRMAGYRGGGALTVELHIPRRATILANTTRGIQVPGTRLFDEPLDTIETNPAVSVSDDFNELTAAEIRRILPAVMHHVARSLGRVLSNTFEADVEPIVASALKHVELA
jgi:hypothetical protein